MLTNPHKLTRHGKVLRINLVFDSSQSVSEPCLMKSIRLFLRFEAGGFFINLARAVPVIVTLARRH